MLYVVVVVVLLERREEEKASLCLGLIISWGSGGGSIDIWCVIVYSLVTQLVRCSVTTHSVIIFKNEYPHARGFFISWGHGSSAAWKFGRVRALNI
jgi:hypothetical protein